MSQLTANQKAVLMEELTGLKRFSTSLTGDRHDADDLLQLTVERVLERGMPEDAHAGKWAYRVCRNLWLDELRAREVRSRFAKAEAAGNSDLGVSDAGGLERLEFERVDQAIDTLSEEQRSVLLLVAVEGRSYAEVSEILDIPIGTVMSRVARARRSLADKIA
ncbi:RNA polymerase sigma factor [Luminiphilus sp.]|nr:RNA polymerase sigma factor [Luminiphilus sp.]MDG1012293.1 RNA polymerase sigma factor [Luminiphilus sp.]